MGVFDLFASIAYYQPFFVAQNMCTQVSSPVSKLEITRLLQPLYVFKSSRAHLRRCVFCSSVSKWGTHLAQTFLRSKHFFQNCLHMAFWYASTTSYIFDRQSRILFDHNLHSSDVSLGNRGFKPSRTGIIFNRKFPSFKSFNPPKNCAHWNGMRSIYTTQFAGLGGSVGCVVQLETRRSRVQPPLRSATFFHGDWSWNIFYGRSLPSADSRRAVVSFWQKNVHNTG